MTEINQETLQGVVERVTFYSEESGFCVLRVQAKKHRELITVVGASVVVNPGETVECWGTWLHHKKHGLQFKAERISAIPPVSLEGITRYLSSGMIKGVGPHFAKRLIRSFGENVFDIIEETPELLATVEGIGKKRQEQIILSWKEQKTIRKIMVFLHSHGVSTTRAVRIYKAYGDLAVEKVRENPYCLAQDIRGIGFKTADELAIRLGVSKDSIQRAQAGVGHALLELCEHGHCAAEYDALVKASVELLSVTDELVKQAIALEISAKRLISEVVDTSDGDKVCLFTVPFHKAEINAVKRLQALIRGDLPWEEIETEKAIPWVEAKIGIQLSESQFQAVVTVLKNKVSIITGGPGVGKTTIVNTVIKIIRAKSLKIALCAPTGRAAKRLSETTGLQAKTIHRLLQFNPSNYAFVYDDKQPLPFDVIIIDESSMMDILLFNHLLKAIPNHAAVIFVGDVDQLPSVGSGLVLADMIRSGKISTVRLMEIFRQAASSRIIINAHRINQGYMPEVDTEKETDFYAIYRDEPEQVYETLIEVVTNRIPAKWGFNPTLDIQVLTPMNRGLLGNTSLNIALQAKINPHGHPTVSRFGTTFAAKDKIIQLVNNYDKEVFNGDIGFIERVDLDESYIQIMFDTRSVRYDFDELDEIRLAYAITIHKSQGSEFPVIVIPLVSQHYVLLARNLLYTAVTRGKKLVVLIGQKKAVYMAVQNNRESKRLTKLTERLIELLS
jgi:exodeoxyribonuclease V alpha subunit